MDFFNRKKLATAEAEIERLKEKYHKQDTEQEDISEKLHIVESNALKYMQKHDENKKIIAELKEENSKLNAFVAELSNRIKINENSSASLDKLIMQRNIELSDANNVIENLKKKLRNAEAINFNIGLTYEQAQDQKIVENKTTLEELHM